MQLKLTEPHLCITEVKSECKFCNIIHDDNRTYGYLAEDEDENFKLFLKCNKSDKSLFVENYGAAVDEKTAPRERTTEREKIFAKYNPVMFNERYCSNYKEFTECCDAGTDVAIIANMGTGKTVAATQHAKQMKSAGIVSFRISLAKKYKDDFDGFKCYLDHKGAIESPKWICQLDSMHRIKQAPPDCLYIDEVSQVRRHLTATTFMKNRNYLKNVEALSWFIRNSKQIQIMDANMTATDIKWIQGIRGKKLKLFINTAIPRVQHVMVVKNEHRVIRMAKKDLADGKKIVIAHNGGKKHHEPMRRQLGMDKNILVINSLTIEDERVCEALANPNKEFGKYDGII